MTTDWLCALPIAARGLHDMNKTLWENTLPAFELAALRGYVIECDVQLSRDGVAMIYHDLTLQRLIGRKERIIDLSSSEIRKFEIGNSGQKIISLETLLEDIDGKAPILVDIHGNDGEDSGLITSVADLLIQYDNKTAMMSKDQHILRRFPVTGQNIPHGLVGKGVKRNDIEAHFSMLAHSVSFVAYDKNDISNSFTRFVRTKLNLPVLAYTVHSQKEWDTVANQANQMIFEGFSPKKESIHINK